MNAAPNNKLVAAVRRHAEAFVLIRKFVVAIGVGLTLASLQLDVTDYGISPTYWRDTSSAVFIVTLALAGAILLLANVLFLNDRFLTATSAVGAVLFGFFMFIPLTLGFGHWSFLGLGSWFALAGSATMALGAAPYRTLFSWIKEPKRPGLSLYGAWIAAALALGLVAIALPRALSSRELPDKWGHLVHSSFWNSAGVITGRNTLGIAIIVLGAVVIASLLGAALVRARLFPAWAVTAALVMLGVTCYYPVHLAVSDLSIIRTGSGLALEGALLAVIATSIAALSQRGIVRLDSSALRQLVALAGLGLALAGTWTKIFRVSGRGFSSYWVDGTLGGFPTILIVICAALVVFSLVTRHWWVLPAASALGWLIAGFFAFDLLQAVPNTNALGPATWLGVIGGVLTGLSAVSLRMFKDWQRHPVTVTPRRAFVWAATAAGLGLLLVSMWLDTEQPYVVSHHTFHNTYWSTVGDHSLGIAMLILAVSAIVALLGFVIARFPALGAWALAASLTLLGIAARQPAQEAFKHLGALRSGGWLALVGSLLASVGAAKMLLCGWPLERAKPEEETVDEVKAQPHAPVKGKQHRVPATRRAR